MQKDKLAGVRDDERGISNPGPLPFTPSLSFTKLSAEKTRVHYPRRLKNAINFEAPKIQPTTFNVSSVPQPGYSK